MNLRCFWFVRMIQSPQRTPGSLPLPHSWRCVGETLGNSCLRSGEQDSPIIHCPPALLQWLFNHKPLRFPTRGERRRSTPAARPSMHQQPVIVLATLIWDLFPTCPLTKESHWSSAWAVLWVDSCLVSFLHCPVLLMGLPGLTLERFLSFWTYVMISGQLTEPHATVGPALFTLLGCCRSVFPHSGHCPCLPCCRSWILDCCPLWGSPALATTWHLQIALGSRKLLVRTCSTAWAGSTLQNF